MKQKSSTYGLLTLALIIWGIIGYRVYKGLNQKQELYNSTVLSQTTPTKVTDDSYTLLLDYKNPFQAGQTIKSNSKNSRTQSKKISRNVTLVEVELPEEIIEEEIIWPDVQYLGLGDKNYKQNETLLLAINGEVQMIGRNEVVEDLRILSSNEDSIKLYYHGETQVFYNR